MIPYYSQTENKDVHVYPLIRRLSVHCWQH